MTVTRGALYTVRAAQDFTMVGEDRSTMVSILRERFDAALHKFADSLFSSPSLLLKLVDPQRTLIARALVGNPILTLGRKNEWDEMGAAWASVVRCDTSDWRMYFSGRDKSLHLRIGLATSSDGVCWKKHDSNPILGVGLPGSWNSYFVYGPIVWKERDSWKMLFTGCDSPHSRHFQVGLAESQNGITWKEFNENPVYDNANPSTKNLFGQYETEAWGILREKGRYYLFHNSVTSKPRQVYIAESPDLKSWKSVSADPILPSKGFPWSIGYMRYCAFPFKHEDRIYVLAATSNFNYHRSRLGLWKLHGAAFPGMSAKFVGYVADTSYRWCKREVDTPFIVPDAANGRLLCYYSGRSAQNKWTEGIAFIDNASIADEAFISINPKAVRE